MVQPMAAHNALLILLLTQMLKYIQTNDISNMAFNIMLLIMTHMTFKMSQSVCRTLTNIDSMV